MEKSVLLLYRCDAWMMRDSMELIGAFDEDGDTALRDTVYSELREISDGYDFDPDEWDVRKCFGKYVKKDLEEAREAQIEQWMDYFFDNDQTPTLRTNLVLEAVPLNKAA